MRNKHVFEEVVSVRCKEKACGKLSEYTIHVSYITNQRGDVIEHSVKVC